MEGINVEKEMAALTDEQKAVYLRLYDYLQRLSAATDTNPNVNYNQIELNKSDIRERMRALPMGHVPNEEFFTDAETVISRLEGNLPEK